MSAATESANPVAHVADDPPPGTARAAVEFLVLLLVGILLWRTFMAEAYVVPTGSMAPTLLGLHRAYQCPNCGSSFTLGADETGASPRPVCPNCGARLTDRPGLQANGDRLLVQKFLFDLRAPRRWESVVFQNPADPVQAYVKRIVGLPGESLLIRDGDVLINGRIARKTLTEQHDLRILVYDQAHPALDSDRFPRWEFRRSGRRGVSASGWSEHGTQLVRSAADPEVRGTDWAIYRHWQPDRDRYGPIQDFLAYNGSDLPGQYLVDDLMVDTRIRTGPHVDRILLRLSHRGDPYVLELPLDSETPPRVLQSARPLVVTPREFVRPLPDAQGHRTWNLVFSIMDGRLQAALDGHLLFDPLDFDLAAPSFDHTDRPAALGVQGHGPVTVERFQLWRDVYYTDALTLSPRRPFGVGEPFHLGAGEYFVLGDNSPVSNDSRFWDRSPVVRQDVILGKPFLVHLPSQVVPLQVFGHEIYWFPDPREIRYIR